MEKIVKYFNGRREDNTFYVPYESIWRKGTLTLKYENSKWDVENSTLIGENEVKEIQFLLIDLRNKWLEMNGVVECHKCGNRCCRYSVMVDKLEIKAIERFLGLPGTLFSGDGVIFHSNKECVFLDENKCMVYPVRPFVCRSYFCMYTDGRRIKEDLNVERLIIPPTYGYVKREELEKIKECFEKYESSNLNQRSRKIIKKIGTYGIQVAVEDVKKRYFFVFPWFERYVTLGTYYPSTGKFVEV